VKEQIIIIASDEAKLPTPTNSTQKICPTCGCKFSRDYTFCRTSCKEAYEARQRYLEEVRKNPPSRRGNLVALAALVALHGFR
jgi:predicted amidophosphoribosyltransferase